MINGIHKTENSTQQILSAYTNMLLCRTDLVQRFAKLKTYSGFQRTVAATFVLWTSVVTKDPVAGDVLEVSYWLARSSRLSTLDFLTPNLLRFFFFDYNAMKQKSLPSPNKDFNFYHAELPKRMIRAFLLKRKIAAVVARLERKIKFTWAKYFRILKLSFKCFLLFRC